VIRRPAVNPATVAVERWGRQYSLKNNGKVEASDGNDMPTQIMVAALPLLFHPRGPEGLDAAIVGFRSGVTVGSALEFPVRSLDAAEIEPAVVESSRFFAHVNHLDYALEGYPHVSDARLPVVNDDGRNYPAATRKRYDVIISEPSNPWLAGVSDLFTTDFFRIGKRKLHPGGVLCQWVQLYEMSPENVKVIYRTFASRFAHVVVFSSEELSSDTILLGSDSPLPLDLEHLQASLALSPVRRELERAGIASAFRRVRPAAAGQPRRGHALHADTVPAAVKRGRLRSRLGQCGALPGAGLFPPAGPAQHRRQRAHRVRCPRDLIAFERYSGYLKTIYAPDWPYGGVGELLTGFGSGARAADNHARQAAAQARQGRRAEAALSSRKSRAAGETAFSRSLLFQLSAPADEQPEPKVDHRRLSPAASLGEVPRARLLAGLREVTAALERSDTRKAWQRLQALPEPLRLHSGPGIRLLNA
jgi:spermidine synthase